MTFNVTKTLFQVFGCFLLATPFMIPAFLVCKQSDRLVPKPSEKANKFNKIHGLFGGNLNTNAMLTTVMIAAVICA